MAMVETAAPKAEDQLAPNGGRSGQNVEVAPGRRRATIPAAAKVPGAFAALLQRFLEPAFELRRYPAVNVSRETNREEII